MKNINISMFRLMFMELKEPVTVVKYGQPIGTWMPTELVKIPGEDSVRSRSRNAQAEHLHADQSAPLEGGRA